MQFSDIQINIETCKIKPRESGIIRFHGNMQQLFHFLAKINQVTLEGRE